MTASRTKVGALRLLVIVMGLLTVAALVAIVALRGLEGPVLAGLAIGAGLGGLNLAVGGFLLSWALRRRPKAALAVSLGGFFVRLGLLLGLTYAFWSVPSVDAVTFAIGFVVFFFLFLVVEIGIVGRASKRAANAGADR
jgi:hypothetical protein